MKFRQYLAYGLPALAAAMPTLPLYIYLPSFYAVEVGLGLATVGAVLLAARIFDTVSDPLAGYVSDRWDTRWGRRKPMIIMGAVLAGLAMLALVHPPEDAGSAYLLSMAVLLYAGWTMVMVPYTALGAELSTSYDERSTITAWREGLMLLGILVASAIPATVAQIGVEQPEVTGLRAIAFTAIVLGVPAFALLAFLVPDASIKRKARATSLKKGDWRTAITTMRQNKPLLRLILAWFLNGLANGFPAVLFLLYMEHGLGIGESDRPTFMLAYFLPAVLFVPLWIWLSRRGEKHLVWCGAMVLTCLAFAVVPFLSPGDQLIFMAVCIVTGATLGADMALPPSIQADVVDYDKWKFDKDRTGVFFALWAMATKLALALAVGIAFPVLDAVGFDPDVAEPQGIWALVLIYSVIPIVIKIIAIGSVVNFPINRKRHDLIQKRLTRTTR